MHIGMYQYFDEQHFTCKDICFVYPGDKYLGVSTVWLLSDMLLSIVLTYIFVLWVELMVMVVLCLFQELPNCFKKWGLTLSWVECSEGPVSLTSARDPSASPVAGTTGIAPPYPAKFL